MVLWWSIRVFLCNTRTWAIYTYVYIFFVWVSHATWFICVLTKTKLNKCGKYINFLFPCDSTINRINSITPYIWNGASEEYGGYVYNMLADNSLSWLFWLVSKWKTLMRVLIKKQFQIENVELWFEFLLIEFSLY